MRVVIATPLYPPEIGGPATYAHVLEEELPSHGISTEILAFNSVRHLPKFIRHMVYFFKLIPYVKRSDVVYALDPVSVGLPAALVAKLYRKKFVVRVAGDYAWEQGTQRFGVTDVLDVFSKRKGTYGFFVEHLRGVQSWVAKQAVAVVVPSEYLKKVVAQWGVSKRKIPVIYTSTQLRTVGNKRTIRGLLQFNGKLIVSAGRLVPWKGFGALIELMPKLLKQFPDLKLFIVGEGPEQERLASLIRKHKLVEHVVRADPMPQDVLMRYIGIADAFVLNTGYEGFSHMLLETMSIGTPVITTDVGGNPELVGHRKNGLLVPYNDSKKLYEAIAKVLSDKALARSLSQEGRGTARTYNKEKMVQESEELLRSVAK